MNQQDYLNKVITFEDGKLLCDGEEISIEEAEKIIKIQSQAMEEQVYDYIQKNPEIDREELTELSDTVFETQMRVAQSKIDIRDLDEYQDIRQDIAKAEEICNKALKIFNFRNKKVSKSDLQNKNKIKWKRQNSDDYEPTVEEMFETGYEILLKEMVFVEFEKQFATADIKVERENIEIDGNFEDEFQIYVITKDIEIYFQINENKGYFEGLKGNYIASGLRVNSMLMQTSLDNYINKSHTIKTAFTFDNVITMEIRYLKNTIKQEINYSLSKSIAKSQERFSIANFFMINFGLLLDRKTKRKLNNIMEESLRLTEESKKQKIKSEENADTDEVINESVIEKTEEVIQSVEEYLKGLLLKVFDLKEEQIRIDKKEVKKDQIFEAQISGQKINISILESGVVLVSSTNTLGTGKTDIQNFEAKGENINDKISNAVLASYIPILYRQIENILNTVKGKNSKKLAKDIEKNLKDTVFDMLENQLNIENFKNKLYFVLDNLIEIDSINYEIIFEIIDRVISNFFLNQFKDTFIEIQDKKQDISKIFSISNATLKKYQRSAEVGDTVFERFENIKKYINRLLSLIEMIKLIQEYKDIKFNSEYINENIEHSLKKENLMRSAADKLSEDNLLGGIARKLLALMDISLSAKDEMFKFNLDELLSELITTNL